MRHNVCLSVGSLGIHVWLCKHINYVPETTVDAAIYRTGVEMGVRARINSLTFNQDIKILTGKAIAISYPMVLAQRGATYFCSEASVEVDSLCGSFDFTNRLKLK